MLGPPLVWRQGNRDSASLRRSPFGGEPDFTPPASLGTPFGSAVGAVWV